MRKPQTILSRVKMYLQRGHAGDQSCIMCQALPHSTTLEDLLFISICCLLACLFFNHMYLWLFLLLHNIFLLIFTTSFYNICYVYVFKHISGTVNFYFHLKFSVACYDFQLSEVAANLL